MPQCHDDYDTEMVPPVPPVAPVIVTHCHDTDPEAEAAVCAEAARAAGLEIDAATPAAVEAPRPA